MANEFDTELMMDEEVDALKAELPPESDVEETTSLEEEKVEKVEPSPPEEKKVEVAEPKVEPQPEPEPVVEKAPSIDGILTKDGKNFIPFSVLEGERAEKATLKAELAELKKPKPVVEVKPPEEVKPPVEEKKFDLDAFSKDIGARIYKNEDDAVPAIKELIQVITEQVTKDVRGTASSVASEAVIGAEFEKRVLAMKKENSWITSDIEPFLVMKAGRLVEERKIAANDLEGLVQAATDVVAEGKKLFRVDEPKVDLKTEIERATKVAYEKAVKDVMAKFNIKEEPVTLSNLRNVNPDVLNKFDELEKLSGTEYEEAYGQLTPAEREAYAIRIDNRP